MNNKMLTVEDANSVLEHFGKAVLDYYTLDTRLLTNSDWFAYDFITVSKSSGSFSFSINNALWTGGYYVTTNIQSPTVTGDENGLTVSGSGLEYVLLVLELSSDFSFNGTIFELAYNPVYFSFIKPFYESRSFSVGFRDKNDNPVTGVNILDKMTGETLTTDSDGLVTVNVAGGVNGLSKYQLQTSTGLDYYFPYVNIKVDLPVTLVNTSIFRNKRQLIGFRFLFDEEYNISDEMLFNDNNIFLTVNGVDYTVNSFNDATFDFLVDLENVGTDTVSMVLHMAGNEYLNSGKFVFVEQLTYFTTDNQSVLQSELSDSDGADVIIYTGTELSSMVNVDREVEIRFTSTVSGGGLMVNSDVVLVTPSFDDVKVIVGDGANLTVDGGTFIHTLDCVIKNNGTGTVTVRDCSFVDNYTCISSKGNVVLSDCVFELGDSEYLDTRSVAFVECLGDLSVNYCSFDINLSAVESIGFGYLFFRISRMGNVNSVSGANLLVNESFPVLKNTSDVNVETERFNVHSKNNKCIVWTVENTNTVYSNELKVEYNV